MMKVHTSLGSQPQKRPQASRAQIAPKIRVKVQHTKATEWMRKLSASRTVEDGRRSSTRPKRPQCSGCSSPEAAAARSEEHTSELQSRFDLVCRLLLEKK